MASTRLASVWFHEVSEPSRGSAHRTFGRLAGGRTEVDFRHAALSNDGFEVVHTEAASRHDDDFPASMIDEFCEFLDSITGVRAAAGRQDAVHTQVNQGVESLERVSGLVKRLVERDAHRSGQRYKLGGLVEIDRCVASQDADNDSGGTKSPGDLDIMAHDDDLWFRVDKVACSRSDQDMNGDAQATARFGYRARARSRSANEQIIAQLDAVRSTGLGGDGRGNVPHADLNQHTPVHRGSSTHCPACRNMV